jgi:hypothetical protein
MLPMLTEFLAFSQILTGVEALDAERGRGYFERLTSGPFDPLVLRILERFGGLRRHIGLFRGFVIHVI